MSHAASNCTWVFTISAVQEPSAFLLWFQLERLGLAKPNGDPSSAAFDLVEDPPLCEALHTIITVGCKISKKDWKRLSHVSNCYREV